MQFISGLPGGAHWRVLPWLPLPHIKHNLSPGLPINSKIRVGKNMLSKKNPSSTIMNVSKVKTLHCSLCKGLFLLQDVSWYRCLGYLTLQEAIYIPDVDSCSHHIGIVLTFSQMQPEGCSIKHLDILKGWAASQFQGCPCLCPQASSLCSQVHPQEFPFPHSLHMPLTSVYWHNRDLALQNTIMTGSYNVSSIVQRLGSKRKKRKMPWVRTANDIKVRVLVKLKKICNKLHYHVCIY